MIPETGSFTVFMNEITSIDLTNEHLAPHKSIEKDEEFIDILPNDMRRLWIVREMYFEISANIAQKIEDEIDSHYGDHNKSETERETSFKNCSQKIEALSEELHEPYSKYAMARYLFNIILNRDFKSEDKKPVLGIRNKFSVICRKTDQRGDNSDPLDNLRHLANESKIILVGVDYIKQD